MKRFLTIGRNLFFSHGAGMSRGLVLLLTIAAIGLCSDAAMSTDWQSQLVVISADGSKSKVIYETDERIEAPNWSPDGQWLVFNVRTGLRRISPEGGTPVAIETGVDRMSNDHVISPNGQWIFFSSAKQIYRIPFAGGEAQLLTAANRTGLAKSTWLHGISPDGKTLTYCGISSNSGGDIWVMSAEGGNEIQLTSSPGHDDGPDYSADGKWIYYNSDGGGSAQIWRIPAAGGTPEQVTNDPRGNWFPHPSPDGSCIIYLSYPPGTLKHPGGKNVVIRGLSEGKSKPRDLYACFGGQGTSNSPNWAPDSSRFAVVQYNPDHESGQSGRSIRKEN